MKLFLIFLLISFNSYSANVKDYGAIGDNFTDDTIAFNNAVSASCVNDEPLHIPSGFYKITSEIIISCSIKIYGDGASASHLVLSNQSQNGFKVTTTKAVIFKDFWITTDVQKTSGSGILFDLLGQAANSRSRIENVNISNQYHGIRFNDALGFTLTNSYIVNSIYSGVHVDNNALPDAGDSYISGCTFDSINQNSLFAIYQSASGGLKITGNKILRHQFGYMLNLDNSIETSILLISNNSFEHQKHSAIKLQKQPSFTGKFYHTIITNNQFNGNNPSFWAGSPTPLAIQQSGSNWFSWLNITGNILQLGANGGIGIELDAVSTAIIDSNIIVSNSGIQRVGISIGANSRNIAIKNNAFLNLLQNVVNASN